MNVKITRNRITLSTKTTETTQEYYFHSNRRPWRERVNMYDFGL